MMKLLQKQLDTDQSVDLLTFAAGEHTVLKEVIMDRHRGVRTYYRLHLSPRELQELSLPDLLRRTRSFGKLSELCAYHGIDPVKVAMGQSSPARRAPGPLPVQRDAYGRFVPSANTHRHA